MPKWLKVINLIMAIIFVLSFAFYPVVLLFGLTGELEMGLWGIMSLPFLLFSVFALVYAVKDFYREGKLSTFVFSNMLTIAFLITIIVMFIGYSLSAVQLEDCLIIILALLPLSAYALTIIRKIKHRRKIKS